MTALGSPIKSIVRLKWHCLTAALTADSVLIFIPLSGLWTWPRLSVAHLFCQMPSFVIPPHSVSLAAHRLKGSIFTQFKRAINTQRVAQECPNRCSRAAQEMPVLVWHPIFHHRNTAVAFFRGHLKVVYLLCGYFSFFQPHGKIPAAQINLKRERKDSAHNVALHIVLFLQAGTTHWTTLETMWTRRRHTDNRVKLNPGRISCVAPPSGLGRSQPRRSLKTAPHSSSPIDTKEMYRL